MWIKASYFEAGRASLAVEVNIIKYDLVVRALNSEEILFKWPLSSLTQTTNDKGIHILTWLPKPDRIEITDNYELKKAPWKKKLPAQLHNSHLSKGLLLTVFFALCGAVFVFILPILANKVPWKVEKYLFENFAPYKENSYCKSNNQPAMSAFQKIISRIHPIYDDDNSFPLEVHVVDSTDLNAFATPGGKIFILSPIIEEAESAEEIAGIIAHEIEHVKKRHILQTIFERIFSFIGISTIFSSDNSGAGSTLEFFMHAQYGQAQESEADQGALKRLVDGKVSVGGINNFFKRLESKGSVPTILSDHPSNKSRSELFLIAINSPSEPILNAEEWAALKQICK